MTDALRSMNEASFLAMDVENMTALDSSDIANLHAAQEFLRGSQAGDAAQAVAKISTAALQHPDVLEVRWEICAALSEWETALGFAIEMCASRPDNSHAWLCRACSLAELNRTQEALETLTSAHDRFPQEPAIAYNLACFSCKMGRRTEAIGWIDKAMRTGGRAETKLMALDDPDLEPLVDYLCSL